MASESMTARVSPSTRPRPFTAHSQTTIGFQPRLSSSNMSRASLALLPLILASQNSLLLFGNRKRLHWSWPCQKQPFTKTTARCFGKTMSGRPGKSFLCSRKRNPALCSAFRTISSGDVLPDLMPAIIWLRFSGLTMSATGSISVKQPTLGSSGITHPFWCLRYSRT